MKVMPSGLALAFIACLPSLAQAGHHHVVTVPGLSKVLDAQGQASSQVPFMTTPPLFPLAAGRSNMIRIIRTGGDLPDDRESLFWLSVASIPQTQGKPSPNSLQVA